MASSYLDVPIFAGQGTDSLHSPQVLEQALRDASLPSSALLLSSCFDAFRTELSFLSPVQLQESGLEPTDFNSPTDILTSRHVHNPIISSTRLFLFQSVRYLAHVDGSNDSPTRFADALKSNDASCGNLVGILGLSSGIIPACVVAASQSSLAYISNAVEAFRLVFWIGVRALGYRAEVLKGGGDRLPWGAVFLGMDREEAGAAIEAFQAKVLSRFQLLVAFDS